MSAFIWLIWAGWFQWTVVSFVYKAYARDSPAKSFEAFQNVLGLVYKLSVQYLDKLKMTMITKQKPSLYVCSHFR